MSLISLSSAMVVAVDEVERSRRTESRLDLDEDDEGPETELSGNSILLLLLVTAFSLSKWLPCELPLISSSSSSQRILCFRA